MAMFVPPGDGWVEGPPFPPDIARGAMEVLRYSIAQVGHEDQEVVFHRYLRLDAPQREHWPVKRMVARRAVEECAICHLPWPCPNAPKDDNA